jgi:hypothetical protein
MVWGMAPWEFGSLGSFPVSPPSCYAIWKVQPVELMVGMYKRSGHEGYIKMAECVERHAARNRDLMAYGEARYTKKEDAHQGQLGIKEKI